MESNYRIETLPIGWADPDARLAVAICHNRMTHTPSEAFAPLRDALEEMFGVT
jgi:hypothetical protein